MPKIKVDRAMTDRQILFRALGLGYPFRIPDDSGVVFVKMHETNTGGYNAMRLNGEHAGHLKTFEQSALVTELEVALTYKDF